MVNASVNVFLTEFNAKTIIVWRNTHSLTSESLVSSRIMSFYSQILSIYKYLRFVEFQINTISRETVRYYL